MPQGMPRAARVSLQPVTLRLSVSAFAPGCPLGPRRRTGVAPRSTALPGDSAGGPLSALGSGILGQHG
eukprot:4916247-Lingulodinium_polyedra.AAC.1